MTGPLGTDLATRFLQLPTPTQRAIIMEIGLHNPEDDVLTDREWRIRVMERIRAHDLTAALRDAVDALRPALAAAEAEQLERDRLTQQNDVNLLILSTLGVEAGRFVPLTQRVEVADALWTAGYRKVVD